jgi:hypothetical protein
LAADQFDFVCQFGRLASDQATTLVSLIEGTEIAYGYLPNEKLAAQAGLAGGISDVSTKHGVFGLTKSAAVQHATQGNRGGS